MENEISSLRQKKTWSLQELPPGHKAIKCKWVYALKKNKEGQVERYKARLVAKGCSQRYGIDYKETFSPVVRYATTRLLLALAVEYKIHLHQLDVVTAYLNGELHDEIYMCQPEGFEDKQNLNKVLRLHKSLYGLKQAGREWNSKLNDHLCNIGFKSCKNEPCLYQMVRNGSLILIAVYVDDLIIGCQDENEITKVKSEIAKLFEVTDKGQLEHFLGMEVNCEGKTGNIELSQSVYINGILKENGMENCKPVSVPLAPGFQIKCDGDCKKADSTVYQSLIGSLLYLALTTRPDILHSVTKLSQKNSDPHAEQMTAAKHLLRYLKGTQNLKMKFSCGGNKLIGYIDADWGGCSTDRKSYSGSIFFIGNSVVSWESKKQNVTALSSTEAEYVSLSNASKEAVYLRRLLQELGFWKDGGVILHVDNQGVPPTIGSQFRNDPTTSRQGSSTQQQLYIPSVFPPGKIIWKQSICYNINQGALQLASNPIYHNRTKHIDIKYHHVRDLVNSGIVQLEYCPTEEMIADIFTKNLSKTKHNKFLNMVNLM